VPQNGRIIRQLVQWFTSNARDLPWRRTKDPYAIWVSEIMLQQTQVKTVIPFYERWMRTLPTLRAVANASSQRIHKLWEGLGYYTRVRNLQNAARLIVTKHQGKFPESFEEILTLPGIGRYTAGAICSIAFGQPAPILDGNIIRVLTRLFGIGGNPRRSKVNGRLWKISEQLVIGADDCSALNQSLMELGALICTPKQPRCSICPVKRSCSAYRHDQVHRLPNIATRSKITPRRFIAFVAQQKGQFLVRQRPAGIVNALLWEFPNIEVPPTMFDAKTAAQSIFGSSMETFEPLCTVRHAITRYKITMDVFRLPDKAGIDLSGVKGRWLKEHQLHLLPFASAHKKVLQWLKP
jgi:A/G-specific adenine glycosylase